MSLIIEDTRYSKYVQNLDLYYKMLIISSNIGILINSFSYNRALNKGQKFKFECATKIVILDPKLAINV